MKNTLIFLVMAALAAFAGSARAQMYEPFGIYVQRNALIQDESGAPLAGWNQVSHAENTCYTGEYGDLIQVIFAGDNGEIDPPEGCGPARS